MKEFVARTLGGIPEEFQGKKLLAAKGLFAVDALVGFLLDREGTWSFTAPAELPTVGEVISASELSLNGPYIAALATALEMTPGEFLKELQNYLGRSLDDKVLTCAASVDGRIRSFRRKGDYAAIVELWDRVRAQLSGDHSNPLPIDMSQPSERETLLAGFLYVFYAPYHPPSSPLAGPEFEPERLKRLADRVLAMSTKPLPLKLYHTLLSLGSEGADGSAPNNAQVLAQLKKHWQQAEKSGVVRDVKAYMLYIEALGRRGDLDALREAWTALINDQACKQLYLESPEAQSESKLSVLKAR
jgi:hypothetical protein